MTKFLILILIFLGNATAYGKIKVVTTTTDIKALVSEVGGDTVDVDSLCKGTQDPHFLEAKPSYMVKVNKADLVIAVGLGLEVGWLPSIVRGARNSNVNPGTNGYLELGPQLNPIEVASGQVTRAQGDVHPEGNPHLFLDPVRVGHAAMLIAERLGKLNDGMSKTYLDRAKAIQTRLNDKQKVWETKLASVTNRKVITYHKTLNYFLDRFKIEVPITMEPKPGIPPTASHIMSVLKTVKENKIKLILIENYFDVKVGERVKEEVPGMQVVSVPAAVEGADSMASIDAVIDNLVNIVAEKAK
jgi:zinc/manganese transport system substrate-binding protein